jgi:6-phosphogluconolactonase
MRRGVPAVTADIQVLDDPAQEAAQLLAAASGHVTLTGGSTPRVAYERAAELREDWSGVDFWFTDERCVTPDHEHSNYGMAERALLSRAGGATVHRMRGELGPEDGAVAYANELEEFGPAALDFILLGVGPDAHICSLFPGHEELAERERRVVGVETPGMAPLVSRITVTLPVVNSSGRIVFLVSGDDKAEAVQRIFAGPPDPRAPGSLVEGNVLALLDHAAAARL